MKTDQGEDDRSVPWMPDPARWVASQDIVPLAIRPCLEDRVNALRGEIRLTNREVDELVAEYERSRIEDLADPDVLYTGPGDRVAGRWGRVWREGDTVYGADWNPGTAELLTRYMMNGSVAFERTADGDLVMVDDGPPVQGGHELAVPAEDGGTVFGDAWPNDWRDVARTPRLPGLGEMLSPVSVGGPPTNSTRTLSRALASFGSQAQTALQRATDAVSRALRPAAGGSMAVPGTDQGDVFPSVLSPGAAVLRPYGSQPMDHAWLTEQIRQGAFMETVRARDAWQGTRTVFEAGDADLPDSCSLYRFGDGVVPADVLDRMREQLAAKVREIERRGRTSVPPSPGHGEPDVRGGHH